MFIEFIQKFENGDTAHNRHQQTIHSYELREWANCSIIISALSELDVY